MILVAEKVIYLENENLDRFYEVTSTRHRSGSLYQ